MKLLPSERSDRDRRELDSNDRPPVFENADST